jgi:aryl-alcohol dehydrogenase-like predicted oxidoreductase
MRYRTVSAIPQQLSCICLGTAQYGSQLSEHDSFALLDRFAEQGGTFLDSAHIYGAWDPNGSNGGCGNSELVIGRWLKARGCRERMVVATKGGHPDFATKVSGMTRDTVRRHLHESLDRLQCDSIDLYWFHRDDRAIAVAEILSWLAEPMQQGLVRAVGCSHWRIDRLEDALVAAKQFGLPRICASQVAWSLARSKSTRTDGPFGEQLGVDDETRRFHAKRQLPLAAYNSQAGGFFAAKYDGLDFHAADFPKPGLARNYGSEENLRCRALARQFAALKGCTTNQIALAWLLNQPFPSFVVIGPGNEKQLDDSMNATAVTLSDAEMQSLENARRLNAH